jgi:hypothetical protein
MHRDIVINFILDGWSCGEFSVIITIHKLHYMALKSFCANSKWVKHKKRAENKSLRTHAVDATHIRNTMFRLFTISFFLVIRLLSGEAKTGNEREVKENSTSSISAICIKRHKKTIQGWWMNGEYKIYWEIHRYQ